MNESQKLPSVLPAHWVFPAPPVCTAFWTNADWVRFAAPYNVGVKT